jgi:hypothetical protein
MPRINHFIVLLLENRSFDHLRPSRLMTRKAPSHSFNSVNVPLTKQFAWAIDTVPSQNSGFARNYAVNAIEAKLEAARV